MVESMGHVSFVAGIQDSLEQRSDRIAGRIRESLNCYCSAISVQIDQTLYSLGMSVAPGEQMLPREHQWADTICARVIQRETALCVEDAREDPALRGLAHVKDAGFAGYLGHPICDSEGHSYGVLCAVAQERRDWSSADKAIVEAAANEAAAVFAIQQLNNEVAGLHKELAEADRILMTLANSVQTLVSVHDANGDLLFATSDMRSNFKEPSFVGAVKRALQPGGLQGRWPQDDAELDDGNLRLGEVAVETSQGGQLSLSALVRRSPADTHVVHWSLGVAQLVS